MTLNKIMESRNIMFNQINNNTEMKKDIHNLNIKLDKVDNKLDEVINTVKDMNNQLKLLISAINDANNIVLC